MIKLIYQDILEVKKGIVIQQVNCQGKFNKGLARNTAIKYPKVAQDYHAFCKDTDPINLLGYTCESMLKEDLVYCLIFGQLFYGNKKERYTDYHALKNGLEYIYSNWSENNLDFYIPYEMGCGLGGGQWPVVARIIELSFDKEQKVYLCINK